jgi:hypothetical protein
MSKKKPTRCPDSIDIEEMIAAHKMRETQEAFDHQQYEKEWLEQLELYSKREPRKFELHVVKPASPISLLGKIALVFSGGVIAGMVIHILKNINA